MKDALATGHDREFSTSSVHFAAFLLYVLGNESHVSTYRLGEGGGAGFRFTFNDAEKCWEMKTAFFSKNGAAVEDARGLLMCSQAIKNTIRVADRSPDGMWMRSLEEQQHD